MHCSLTFSARVLDLLTALNESRGSCSCLKFTLSFHIEVLMMDLSLPACFHWPPHHTSISQLLRIHFIGDWVLSLFQPWLLPSRLCRNYPALHSRPILQDMTRLGVSYAMHHHPWVLSLLDLILLGVSIWPPTQQPTTPRVGGSSRSHGRTNLDGLSTTIPTRSSTPSPSSISAMGSWKYQAKRICFFFGRCWRSERLEVSAYYIQAPPCPSTIA